jgi:hypothetical protein
MGTRATYDRRIEQLESAVIARGRRVAARRPGAPAALEIALDARLRRVALHVLAVAEAARLLLRPVHHRPRMPVA